MKTRYGILLVLALLLPLAAVGVSGGSVFAQSYCSVQVGTAAATTHYYGSNSYGSYSSWNIQLTLPVSASCQNMGETLWAVGNAYDKVANTNVGSANTAINSNGGYNGGQLVFTLPPSAVEHPLQISITLYSNYNGQYGSVVGSTSQTLTIHSNSYSTPAYPYNNSPTYPSYPFNYYQSYPSYYNGYPMYYYYYNGYYYYYYPSGYYYYYPNYQQVSACYNGQAIVYYNGAYYYVSCYQYYHHHH